MTLSPSSVSGRRKAVWGPKRTLAAALVLAAGFASNALAGPGHQGRGQQAGKPNSFASSYKLDHELTNRSERQNPNATTPVIIEWQPGAQVPRELKKYLRRNGKLTIINSYVGDLPNGILKQLAAHPAVFRIHYDRPAKKLNYLTSLTTGARAVQETLGLTGAGIGVAVADSGIVSFHDDLTNRSSTVYPFGNQRVAAFVDFVNGRSTPYDDNGHGTHVAGIIAGNGYDSNGRRMGAAPDASLIGLKVLDANGAGSISNVIAALDWVLANHAQYNIRVINLSVSADVTESYWTDPLTLAAKRVVDAGVVVVAAAGNRGKNAAGQIQYGAIGAPGNAPWVLTVGASSTHGTATRDDDTIAGFSSRGPTYIDWGAKPDLVAPGAGTLSLAAPEGTFYTTKASSLVAGSIATAYLPYLSLSGTSMAAPVVSGTVALMLQANPNLTPSAVKAILEYTAQEYPGYNALTQGAGFLNAVGALRLARFFATAQPGDAIPTQSIWSKKILWGNQLLSGGVIDPSANAFSADTTWGAAQGPTGNNIVWGTSLAGNNIVWGTSVLSTGNIVWGTSLETGLGTVNNIVWGTDCGGEDCDNIVWGTSSLFDNIVWGTASPGDNIVWGTSLLDLDNIVWGTSIFDDNIVWGTASDGDNIVWGTGPQSPDLTVAPLSGSALFDQLSDLELLHLIEYVPPPPPPPPPPPTPLATVAPTFPGGLI